MNEEANKEAIGEEESKKEELGTKGDRDDEVIRIYMFVLVWIQLDCNQPSQAKSSQT